MIDKNYFVKRDEILPIMVVLLFIITSILLLVDNPYWYVSIVSITLALVIILLKITWTTSCWLDDKIH